MRNSFKFTDYIITPMDIVRGVLALARKAALKDWGIAIFLTLIFFAVYSYLGWQFDSSLVFIFFLAMFFWNLDSRISIGLALACLIIVPFLLALEGKFMFFHLNNWSQQVAVWAYYFLVIGVAKQIWDFRKGGGEEEEISDDEKREIEPMKPEKEEFAAVSDVIVTESKNVLDLRNVKCRIKKKT